MTGFSSVADVNRHLGPSPCALARAACLQRIRLVDRRTGAIYDESPAPGEEPSVASFFVVHEDSPPWAIDPEDFWNRAQERGADDGGAVERHWSSLAPLCSDQADALALAQRVAAYLTAAFDVPMTVAIHGHMDQEPGREPEWMEMWAIHLMVPVRRVVRGEEADAGTDMAVGFGAQRTNADLLEIEAAFYLLMDAAAFQRFEEG